MAELETTVTTHYDTGAILERIKAGLIAAGADAEAPQPADLKGVDEFHTGGLEATEALLGPLGLTAEMSGLDVGSGIGGTARFIAESYGSYMHGVDLTPAFVAVATSLSEMCGLGHRTGFLVGSALEMPVSDASFDFATMLHVGMNIEDKTALMRDVARVLKPGGRFALFDIMQGNGEAITFPVPWSSVPESSFVVPPQAYRDAAAAAGLTLVAERNRGDYSKEFFGRVSKAMVESGPSPMGLQLIMGEEAPVRYGNAMAASMQGITETWEMVFQKG
ncbi:gamma-tocopherol methyltransferase [Candidatus Rhodobacter oscarellae]|uniref:Gamma-tocopherol methyltransferase n=1 Tax=Candidatus Rhodobacter oscarellae TaxID=1675527 RepID=A0A0J9E4Y7_9RHOB|nr:methyltransferase domain-containing protein [Candidatus Rhodobacter lobularis]KMW57802.1 gamma-tocopherol methyltransferase [Candidatus Rhodobacter lobularis]